MSPKAHARILELAWIEHHGKNGSHHEMMSCAQCEVVVEAYLILLEDRT